jgi:serine/threonine protein kinase
VNRFGTLQKIYSSETGPSIAFYGCLWTGVQVVVEPLTPSYDLTTNWMDDTGRGAIAASLTAFLKAVKRLEHHYLNLPTSPLHDRAFPYQTSYLDEAGEQVDFKYEARIPSKLVFFAKPRQERIPRLCVKFVRTYSAEAHKFLASLGHAPQLRAFIPLPGGWHMVVMDNSPYSLFSDATVWLLPKSRQMVVSTVNDAVRALHSNKLVHGDIRETNILAQVHGNHCAIHLMDFDWAGKIGEARYPMPVNTKTAEARGGFRWSNYHCRT